MTQSGHGRRSAAASCAIVWQQQRARVALTKGLATVSFSAAYGGTADVPQSHPVEYDGTIDVMLGR